MKGKKEKVQSTKVDIIPPAQIPYQKYSEQQLQAIIDNANNELVRRGNMSMSKYNSLYPPEKPSVLIYGGFFLCLFYILF